MGLGATTDHLAASTDTIPAWRAQDGEAIEDWVAFIWWALGGGELREELSKRYQWAHRRQVIETYETLEGIPLSDQGAEAAVARVRITLVEIMKLQRRVMSTPEQVIDAPALFASVDWMLEASQGMEERRAKGIDWGKLTPEEREIMIKAKQIQDRLMGD